MPCRAVETMRVSKKTKSRRRDVIVNARESTGLDSICGLIFRIRHSRGSHANQLSPAGVLQLASKTISYQMRSWRLRRMLHIL
jgi:hypothetical protein